MSIGDFAEKCGVGYSTARDWQETPKWVPYVLSQMELMQILDLDNEDLEIFNKKVRAFEAIQKITKEFEGTIE